mgnify:CR=1 FL=1
MVAPEADGFGSALDPVAEMDADVRLGSKISRVDIAIRSTAWQGARRVLFQSSADPLWSGSPSPSSRGS